VVFLFLKKIYPMETKQEELNTLKKKAKTFKMILIVYGSVLIMMCIVAFLSTQKDGISFMTFFPLFFLPMEIINYVQFKKVQKEIAILEQKNE